MKAFCIGCGCDEDHGCNASICRVGEPTCFWLHFDPRRGVGVCSECGDLLKAWKEGQRAPYWTLIAERFYRQVLFLYDDRAAALLWMRSPQPILNGRSPRELILQERLEEVQTVLDLYREGVFI